MILCCGSVASTSFFGRVKKFASNLDISSFRKWAPLALIVLRFFFSDQKASMLKRSFGIFDHAAAIYGQPELELALDADLGGEAYIFLHKLTPRRYQGYYHHREIYTTDLSLPQSDCLWSLSMPPYFLRDAARV